MIGQQMDLLKDGLDHRPGRYRRSDPETSRAGARAVQLRAGTQKALLLAAYASAGTALTDEEAAMRARVPMTSEYSKRCGELRQAGLVVQVLEHGRPVTRTGSCGVERILSTITPLGRQLVQEQG